MAGHGGVEGSNGRNTIVPRYCSLYIDTRGPQHSPSLNHPYTSFSTLQASKNNTHINTHISRSSTRPATNKGNSSESRFTPQVMIHSLPFSADSPMTNFVQPRLLSMRVTENDTVCRSQKKKKERLEMR